MPVGHLRQEPLPHSAPGARADHPPAIERPRPATGTATRAQQRVLDALRSLTLDGWPVSVRDVGEIAGLASPSTTHHHLLELERLGLAARSPRSHRIGWLPTPVASVEYITILDALIAERQRILEACPCPVHGPCVPHVLEQLAMLRPVDVELHPPYSYEVTKHGPATIYDGIDVGWIARVKESLPHKEQLAQIIVNALNRAAGDA